MPRDDYFFNYGLVSKISVRCDGLGCGKVLSLGPEQWHGERLQRLAKLHHWSVLVGAPYHACSAECKASVERANGVTAAVWEPAGPMVPLRDEAGDGGGI